MFAGPIPWYYAGYCVAGAGLARLPAGRVKDALFALVNVGAVLMIFFVVPGARLGAFGVYLAAVCGCYLLTRLTALRDGWLPWLAFFAPIALLVAVRAVPLQLLAAHSSSIAKKLAREPEFSVAALFLGLSYLAFRCSRMVLEIRNRVAPMPGFFRYLGFAFFLPVMPVGPIHSWKEHSLGLDGAAERAPVGTCVERIVVGLAKSQFIASLFNQLGYSQLLLDGRLHGWLDLAVACFSYYPFLYLNFSGACDVAIGMAGLVGIPVPENFESPLLARNLRDFWNRWHITLSVYMRDIVFAPVSKWLIAGLGMANAHHAMAAAMVVVFLLIGIWHGSGWNYAAFGLVHAVGVAANHYYGLWLKRRLTPTAWRSYQANVWVHRIAVVLTFTYVAASLFFFANSPTEMRVIFHVLR
jgi:D-alanyl-lipoteichoic acid acyltransferase DltB (MBOAT superfamily)